MENNPSDELYYLDSVNRTILLILASNGCYDKERAMRFKELERQLDKYRERSPKGTHKKAGGVSTPTFIKHLEELRKMKAINRTRRGSQNVGYYLTDKYVSPAELVRSMEWFKQQIEAMKALSMKESAMVLANLFFYRDLKLVKMLIQSKFEPLRMRIKLKIQSDFLTMLDRQYLYIFLQSIKTKEGEYEETLRHFDSQIDEIGKSLFQQ